MSSLATPASCRCSATRVFRSAPRDESTPGLNQSRGLPPERERELAAKILAGDLTARDELVTGNLAMARYFAKRFANSSTHDLSIDELAQAGAEGLIIAAGRFDPSVHGTRFSTYATYWVRQRIRRTVMWTGESIRLPDHLHYKGVAASKRSRVNRVDCTRLNRTVKLDPLERLIESEERERLSAALAKLGTCQRTLLSWYLEGDFGPAKLRSQEIRDQITAAEHLLSQLRETLNPQEGSTNG